VIRGKIVRPALGDGCVYRPRLAGLINELISSYGVVWVTATAGAGKTTAVVEALRNASRPIGWLTLGPTEKSPGSLVTYLEHAIRHALPGLSSVAAESLTRDVPHAEAAGVLGESLQGSRLLLVLDEVEWIADSTPSVEVLSVFLRYLPRDIDIVLISRSVIPLRLGSSRFSEGAGLVGEYDLAFTVAEAEQALALRGQDVSLAASATAATGGWVAGVLFEAWRSPEHVHGSGGEADGLRSYLSSEIMSRLSEEQQHFLVVTSVLDDVTVARAEALGLSDAGEMMASLGKHGLPLTYSTDGLFIRYHSRFRDYLRAELELRGTEELTRIRARHGALLDSEHRYDEAVDEYLAAGDRAAALQAAERGVMPVVRRLDLAIIERWIEVFDPQMIEQSVFLTYGHMLVLIEHERWGAAAKLADRLLALRGNLSTLGPMIATEIAWCYFVADRNDDAHAVTDMLGNEGMVEAVRFGTRVDIIDDPTHYRDRPDDTDTFADMLLARIDHSHGRFSRVLERRHQTGTLFKASHIAALRAVGRLDEALQLCRGSDHNEWTMVRFNVEVLADLGRPAEARAVLARGHEVLLASGSPIFALFEQFLHIMIDLRFDRDTADASRRLAVVEESNMATSRVRIVEQLHLFWGIVHLIDEENDLAVARLRQAVDVMRQWDTLLLLPQAAVCLAEAEWRTGDAVQADAAADLAIEAAQRQGSNHLLLQSLRDFPAVVSRRLDAIESADSVWHDLGRSLIAVGVDLKSAMKPQVLIREFTEPAIVVDGNSVATRLSKTVEIAALMAQLDGRVSRVRLRDEIFEGHNDESARSYLRQALTDLRKVFPPEVSLQVDADEVTWDADLITSESVVLQSLVRAALERQGRDKQAALLSCLATLESGAYLPRFTSQWALDRTDALGQLTNEVLSEAAQVSYDLADYATAHQLANRLLRRDPYRESAWRLSMSIAGEMGDGDRVIELFRACQESLRSVGAEPADSTKRLLRDLRR